MASKLKPCPFCGSRVRWDRALDEARCNNDKCLVVARSEFRDAWNRRAIHPAIERLMRSCRAVITAEQDESEKYAAHGGYGFSPMRREIIELQNSLSAIEALGVEVQT